MNEDVLSHQQDLSAHLAAFAAATPDFQALIRLDVAGEPARVESTATLAQRVAALAAGMLDRGWAGERVVLAIGDESDFACAFIASLAASVIAVPAVAPGTTRNNDRLAHFVADSGATAVVVDEKAARQLRLRAGALPVAARMIELESLVASAGLDPAGVPPESTAYLQYTSGSTRAPKGVVITRANLDAQLKMLRQRFPLRVGECLVNPMPLYHDFGLVMSLHALASGAALVLLPSLYAIRDPLLWLRAITGHRAALTNSAPFLLDLCTRKIDDARLGELDLRSLRVLLTGAEPIPAGYIDDFTARFGSCGFARGAMCPAYGLAEATLMLTSAGPDGPVTGRFDADKLRAGRAMPARDGEVLVSSGQACFEDSVRIVSPAVRRSCAEREVGEVWVRAPCVSPGYWRNTDASVATMRNQLPGEDGQWLRTGDLGFVDGKELFVMGRISDTLIIRGENRYPQDIEWAVSGAHPAIQPDGVAAFATASAGLESLVLVCEVRRVARRTLKADDVFRAIRRALVEKQGLVAEYIVLIPEANLPKTSSGKLARRRCRGEFERGGLKVLAEWRAPLAKPDPAAIYGAGAGSDSLLGLCRRMLRAPQLRADDDLFANGLDSLRAAELVLEIEDRWGSQLDLFDFDTGVTAAALQQAIDGLAVSERISPAAKLQTPQSGSFEIADTRRMQSFTASWRADWGSPSRLVFGRNLDGSRPPLAWCFQGFREFEALAEWLGEDQPLYGMRSAHYVVAHDDAPAMAGLATIYLEELAHAPDRFPARFGGNCQGSVVAMAMARALITRGDDVEALFLLENITPRLDPRPVPVPVAQFFGEHSREFNPYLLFPDPEPGWEKLYPGGYSVDIIAADHGGYFRAPGIEVFSRALAARLQQVPKPAAAGTPRTVLLQEGARTDLRLAGERSDCVSAGQELELQVNVTNQGPRAAHPEDSLILANHWLSSDEAVVQWLDGYKRLLEPLVAGQSAVVPLHVRAPAEPGQYVLEVDVAEQGVAWFSECGGQPLRIELEVSRPGES